MKTGTLGRAWVRLEQPKPPPVADHYAYWMGPPPQRSERCTYWLRQIERGWLPNKHWRAEGYDSSAEVLYGVYIWEFINEIAPAVSESMNAESARPSRS